MKLTGAFHGMKLTGILFCLKNWRHWTQIRYGSWYDETPDTQPELFIQLVPDKITNTMPILDNVRLNLGMFKGIINSKQACNSRISTKRCPARAYCGIASLE